MLIGVSEERFWSSNPRKLNPYTELYFKKQVEIDRIAHRMGAYIYEAFSIVMNNAFSKKTLSYPKNPYMAEEEERRKMERMTKEEKLKKVEEIFEMLSGGQN